MGKQLTSLLVDGGWSAVLRAIRTKRIALQWVSHAYCGGGRLAPSLIASKATLDMQDYVGVCGSRRPVSCRMFSIGTALVQEKQGRWKVGSCVEGRQQWGEQKDAQLESPEIN